MVGEQMVATVEANFTKSRRTDVQPIPDWAFSKVETWLADRPADEPLFPLLKQRKTEELIKGDLAAAGVPYRLTTGETRDFHALRHTFISRCFASGTPALVVMAQACHSDIRRSPRWPSKVSLPYADLCVVGVLRPCPDVVRWRKGRERRYPQVEQNATQLSRCDVSTSDECTSASAADSGVVGSKGDASDDLARLIATWPTLAPEVKASIIALAFGTGAE